MTEHANILGYFWQAGLVVKSVMLFLLAASISSWTLIIQRYWYYKQVKKERDDFYERFQRADDLTRLYNYVEHNDEQHNGMASIFYTGFKEFLRIRQSGVVELAPITRVMQISVARHAAFLEKHLPLFASIGSIAPFVGLFGTVWGIMTSFQALGHAQQATIAMVAPGISEALVATALGLFTAIPAVIAFNRYSTEVNGIIESYELFQEELLVLFERQKSARRVAEPEHA